MALISMHDVRWGFGEPYLLDGISLNIEKGERVGLLGRNGVGKTSLLRLLNREILPDGGEIVRQQGVRVAVLEQDVPTGFTGTVFDVVAGGRRPATDDAQKDTGTGDEWTLRQQVESVLFRTGLDPDKPFADLSAGMKRRTLFARALAMSPDLLLLDEPTNHLDIDSIVWLEDFLLRQVKTLMFITHDRMFLEKIATRIMELDRGRLTAYACDYKTYLQRRRAELEIDDRHQRHFDRKLSQEEAWIRQGIKARRTRNEGRVRALEELRAAARRRRARIGLAHLEMQEAERSGRLVIEAEELTYRYGDRPIVKDFSTTIMRGDKIGIIGPNGAGKTTLIRLLLGDIAPDSGTVRHGTCLQTAFFDQLRTGLDEQKTVVQNISTDNDYIVFNGRKRHVISYLQDFLFSPERCRTPVYVLSGGERNRLMLARLFTRPANLLVLDEPTNDLDAETLELLEELLFSFDGTLLLVSHDRSFLNHIVTSTLVFEGPGQVVEYAGGYDDWLLQRPRPEALLQPEPKPAPARRKPEQEKTRRLTFAQNRELAALPSEIEALEAELDSLQAAMADPSFYKQSREKIVGEQNRLKAVEERIAAAYRRWEELDALPR
ncbi:MAG: ATP-binding cassette domain-containing protein [Thermodesulfobacteriota bacterium]